MLCNKHQFQPALAQAFDPALGMDHVRGSQHYDFHACAPEFSPYSVSAAAQLDSAQTTATNTAGVLLENKSGFNDTQAPNTSSALTRTPSALALCHVALPLERQST
jgi:hypothetical protein